MRHEDQRSDRPRASNTRTLRSDPKCLIGKPLCLDQERSRGVRSIDRDNDTRIGSRRHDTEWQWPRESYRAHHTFSAAKAPFGTVSFPRGKRSSPSSCAWSLFGAEAVATSRRRREVRGIPIVIEPVASGILGQKITNRTLVFLRSGLPWGSRASDRWSGIRFAGAALFPARTGSARRISHGS